MPKVYEDEVACCTRDICAKLLEQALRVFEYLRESGSCPNFTVFAFGNMSRHQGTWGQTKIAAVPTSEHLLKYVETTAQHTRP